MNCFSVRSKNVFNYPQKKPLIPELSTDLLKTAMELQIFTLFVQTYLDKRA